MEERPLPGTVQDFNNRARKGGARAHRLRPLCADIHRRAAKGLRATVEESLWTAIRNNYARASGFLVGIGSWRAVEGAWTLRGRARLLVMAVGQ
jgi:hypothetical protein